MVLSAPGMCSDRGKRNGPLVSTDKKKVQSNDGLTSILKFGVETAK